MNKFLLLLLASLISASSFAQALKKRGHVENTTNYSLSSTYDAKVRKVGTRASAPLPCVGNPKIPVVLVQFKDTVFKVGDTPEKVKAVYDDFFNLKEGHARPSNGSVWQYFNEQSGGLFSPQFEVIGPVTLKEGYAYYGKDAGDVKDVNISAFYSEACKSAMTKFNVNWKDFDNNDDGKVDMVFFIFAGEGQNGCDDNNTIWPKEGVYDFNVVVDGQKLVFGAYGCTCECYNYVQDGIGTACHEMSHGLGLPDFYDTSYTSFGMDYWDLMDCGSYQIAGRAPIGYTAYERDFMGWKQVVELEVGKPYSLELKPIETDGVAYKIINPKNPNEYFILENKQNIGYDTYMPWPGASAYNKYGGQHGLMITHVDYSESLWSKNQVNVSAGHQRMTLAPADGVLVSSNDGMDANWVESIMGDLYPGRKNVTEAVLTVYTGGKLSDTVTNIREVNGIIKLDINGGTVVPVMKDSLAKVVAEAEKYANAKMNAKVAESLAAAVSASQNMMNTEEDLATAIQNIKSAMETADASIEVYKAVAAIIADVDKKDAATKKAFEATGIKNAYEDGTLISVDEANDAYAVALESVKLEAVVADAAKYDGVKMSAAAAASLESAISASKSANTKDAIIAAAKVVEDAMVAAEASKVMYESVASIIADAEKLGDAGKESFKASGVKEAYDNGTITSLEDVLSAYQKALKAQEIADGIDGVDSDSNIVDVYGMNGVKRFSKMGGINIIRKTDGTVEKVLVK